MKATRGGHTFSCKGATGYIDETTEDRQVLEAVKKYLLLGGDSIIDVTPDDSFNTQTSELSFGVSKANFKNVDNFASIHFNASTTTNEIRGSEIWLYSQDSKLTDEAIRILRKLEELGFRNRGIKYSKDLYELKYTNCPAMIIEVCFVDSKADTDLYKSLGSDRVGKAIAEGILNKTISEPDKNVPRETNKHYRVQVGYYSIKQNAIDLQNELKSKGFDSIIKEE